MKTAYYADAADIEQNKEDQNKAKPTELSKSNVRVFPNPFKDRFTVEYQLPAAQDVEISVYSTSGQKVKQIKLNDQAAGNYRRDISASGNEFAEGLYHVNIKTSDKVIKKSLMKLK
jgi:membrane-bound inhibitor of C-type lysozyme